MDIVVRYRARFNQPITSPLIELGAIEIHQTCPPCLDQRRYPYNMNADIIYTNIYNTQNVYSVNKFTYQYDLTDCPCPEILATTLHAAQSDGSPPPTDLTLDTSNPGIDYLKHDIALKTVPNTYTFWLKGNFADGSSLWRQFTWVIRCLGGNSMYHLGYPKGKGIVQW